MRMIRARAAERQFSIADITLSLARLKWPALARRTVLAPVRTKYPTLTDYVKSSEIPMVPIPN